MLKKLLTFSVLLSFSLPMTASAAPPDKAQQRFYDMGEWVIDGEIKKPSALWVQATKRPRFDPLLRLKKSFLPDITKSAREVLGR